MKTIEAKKITDVVSRLCKSANYYLPEDVWKSLEGSLKKENTELGKMVFDQILGNARIATQKNMPLCQDTGLMDIFIKLGQNVRIEGGSLKDAVNLGVAKGCKEGYLRNSMVKDPLDRINTGDNTPAQIYIDIVEGDVFELTVMPKGGGSENASVLKMLIPSDGWQGVHDFIMATVREKAISACPPVIVGVGIGGSFSSVALLAKKALLRPIGSNNEIYFYSAKEKELLNEINEIKYGPMGLGGEVTALAVHINTAPCHIASLPVAVSMQCHSCRRIRETI
jgi:fumarate hydratase subunit alpha